MFVSLVVPIYNERENIPLLYDAVTAAMDPSGHAWELLFVDDGSRDGSTEVMLELAQRDDRVKLVELRRNYGQTAAMSAGIQAAQGEVVVTLDGDLQNDPSDIPMMIAKIEEGYDLVHGWRKRRQDAFVNRKLPSKIANWLISRVTNFPVHDLGCTLKAIRTEIAQELELYGEMHRFIPILAHWRGARCVEVETNHHPRRFGVSKYGISRTVRVLLDLITVKYLVAYLTSPMKLFGRMGLWCGGLSALSAATTIGMKLRYGTDMTGNPLLLLSCLAAMVATQFFVLGMLGELASRIFFAVQKCSTYAVRRTVNLDAPATIPWNVARERRAA